MDPTFSEFRIPSFSDSDTLLQASSSSSSDSEQVPFVLPDVTDDNGKLPPEIGNADISIAADGSFVETSSGLAARELKKRYDQHYGVNVNIRSPYAITAFINQHGKQMYRVGRRELQAPAAQAEKQAAQPNLSSPGSERPRHNRLSRLSVQGFLPPVKFKSSARPQTAHHPSQSSHRKLRKARSIPDMPLAADASEALTQSYTGRQHSQSVTAADMPRFLSTSTSSSQSGSSAYHHSHKDIFSDMMDWFSMSASTLSTPSTRSIELGSESSVRTRHVTSRPFGPRITFVVPNKKKAHDDFLPVPSRNLRAMQSNDSMMTARQDSPVETQPTPTALDNEKRRTLLRHPPSMLLLSEVKKPPPSAPTPPPPEIAVQPQYPTSVFDVLQTYRGLPLFDKLIDDGENTTVIKMSTTTEESIAPRDDPRFVIWGEIHMDDREEDIASQMSNHGSINTSPTMSRKRGKSAASLSVSIPSTHDGHDPGFQRVLLAATVERWIAQLTSDLNYDDLLDFFLTYRTYVSAVDLCHLLVSRFHWTLEQPQSPKDEMVRRVARVRTFVAFRFWLNKFFAVDFLPNRELRLLLSNWLNGLVRDPILKSHADGLNTVKKLRKVVKDRMKSHLVLTSRTTAVDRPTSRKSSIGQHVLGERFAEATRRLDADDEDSDIDLDFYAEGASDSESLYSNPVNSHVSTAFSPPRPSAPASYSAMTILKQTMPDSTTPIIQSTATLPIHHGAFSRAFVKTIGRLGRWKRVLNSHPLKTPDTGSTAEVSAFDLELSVARDLLTVNGGVEQYLKLIEPPPNPEPLAKPSTPATSRPQSSAVNRPQPPSSTVPAFLPLPFVVPTIVPPKPVDTDDEGNVPQGVAIESAPTPPAANVPILPNADLPSTSVSRASTSIQSFRSSSTESFGDVTSVQPSETYPWAYNIAPIDELDLSDNSSDEGKGGVPGVPPGLRTAKKQLPNRRDFEFVHPESVSSMGITSRASTSSEASGSLASDTSMELGNGPIQQWQVNAIIDSLSNDEEDGDVEAALRRLEGEINPERQKEKESKVDGWVQSIRQRILRGDFGDEQPRFQSDSDEDESTSGDVDNGGDEDEPAERIKRSSSVTLLDANILDTEYMNPTTPLASQASHKASGASAPNSPIRAADARPMPEDVVPAEILQSRIVSMPLKSESFSTPAPSKGLGSIDTPRMHRSFVLGYRAETLVEHFSMIDRELFMGVKFEELVLDDWMSCEEVDILDWPQYLRDRTRWKAESRFPQKTSALATVRARFNLVANFTIAEIVLTRPSDRAQLVNKFIRIAWKAYCKSNFSTLVAIVAGLKSEWVTKAMGKSWSKVGIWEQRIYKDLKEYTSHTDNFKYIRAAVNSITDREQSLSQPTPNSSATEPSPNNKSKATSGDRPPAPSACIPFIGIYLSQLYQYSKLPDLIDPTAPYETVSVDPITSNFDTPAHPEVFSALAPLPPSMQLEPLINVHKQRLIAAVIKSLVTGQHLARRVQFPLDKKLFQKSLKLRGLSPDDLHQRLAVRPD